MAQEDGSGTTQSVATGTVLFISSELLGRGEDAQLGGLLMQSFLHTVGGLSSKPDTVLLVNTGVRLAAAGSPVLEELRQLESQGIEILACGTCVSRFQLNDKIGVGKVSNMPTIADTLLKSRKIVSL